MHAGVHKGTHLSAVILSAWSFGVQNNVVIEGVECMGVPSPLNPQLHSLTGHGRLGHITAKARQVCTCFGAASDSVAWRNRPDRVESCERGQVRKTLPGQPMNRTATATN